MAAFQQSPVSFLMDSVFFPNMSAIKTPSIDEFIPNFNQFYSSSENSHQPLMSYNCEGSSIDGNSAHESSCLEQQSTNEPSSVTEKQRNDSLSMVENAESCEQVTPNRVSAGKKRKSRKGFSPNSANSKKGKQVKGKKQKEDKEDVKDEKNNDNKTTEEPPKGYIHVRARRGQATDSHSLAERVRREKISERMKMLQGLVPGCDKVTGKALMLDEIINYVQSLQNQVEFLSLKLASVDPTIYTFGLMDHESMLFGSQAINNDNMTFPVSLMQPTSNGGIDQPQALANTNPMSCSATSSASTTSFPSSIVDSSTTSLFQQEQKPNLFPPQDAGSLYWGLNEHQRQNIINQIGFNNTNFYSFQ